MIINGQRLLDLSPIIGMEQEKMQAHGVSYGLTESGYDIRVAQDIKFIRRNRMHHWTEETVTVKLGNFVLASSMEKFDMPIKLMGMVMNKSTWARRGLDASMTTNIEPGWHGHLTIELLYNGQDDLFIPAGSGICQIIFHELAEARPYRGKYQNQENKPVPARDSN